MRMNMVCITHSLSTKTQHREVSGAHYETPQKPCWLLGFAYKVDTLAHPNTSCQKHFRKRERVEECLIVGATNYGV